MRPASSVLRCILACLVALFALIGHAQQPVAARVDGAGVASLSSQIDAASVALAQQRAELAALHHARATLDERMRWVERRAAVNALGGQFAQTLTDYLRQLPVPERFRVARERRAELMAAASDEELRVERALHELKPPRAVASSPGVPPETPVDHIVLDQEQREAMQRLAALLRENLETLEETNTAARELEQKVVAARRTLSGYLFWIPTSTSLSTLSEFAPALAWTLSPTNWRAAGAHMGDALERRTLWPLLTLLAAGGLLLLRGRLRGLLVSLSPEVVTWEWFRVRDAMAGCGITLALALPVPMLLWTGAALLSTAPEDQGFTLALAGALRSTAVILLGLSSLVWLISSDGLAIRYFGRSQAELKAVALTLRRFTAPFVLLLALAALNMVQHAPNANRESLGRLAFSLVMLCCAAFLARHLRFGGPLMERLAGDAPNSWGVRLHLVWYGVVVALPLVGFAFAAVGYSIAAAYFWTLVVESLFLALGASVLYGMVGLWVKVKRLHFARIPDAGSTLPAASLGVSELAPPDITAVGEQARSLLETLITLSLFSALWWVWQDAIPVLQWIGNFPVWRGTEWLDGKQVVHVLTIGQLFMAIVVGVVTGLAVAKVGALFDIVLLQRLGVQADAAYAAKAITRYSLAAAGILVASGILGIGWGDVQWLIAALGVGLGFGLQEIVANFVSGLIVLAERPIRIGDVVTVDKITGRVARIRARATVVVDFDNKEVIIPNKAFITGPVINWTLSSQISRLVLKVSFPRGSDIARIQKRIVEDARLVPGVVPDPPPAVFFTSFADKTLDFEIHAYVGSVNDRFEVQHQINLAAERVLREEGGDIPPS